MRGLETISTPRRNGRGLDSSLKGSRYLFIHSLTDSQLATQYHKHHRYYNERGAVTARVEQRTPKGTAN